MRNLTLTIDARQTSTAVTAAVTMYRERDMQFWLEQTEKEMGKLR